MKVDTSGTGLRHIRIHRAVQLRHIPTREGLASNQYTTSEPASAQDGQIVHGLPEICSKRLAELRTRIQTGTYQVNSMAIARKMLGSEGSGQRRESYKCSS